MDKDMPAIKYLDIAAKAMGMPCWRYLNAIACDYRDELRDGAIAHARTLEALAKYEPEPVDPDLVTAREICAMVARHWHGTSAENRYLKDRDDNDAEVQFALAKLKEARGK